MIEEFQLITHVVCLTPCTQCVAHPGSNEDGDNFCPWCRGSVQRTVNVPLERFARLFVANESLPQLGENVSKLVPLMVADQAGGEGVVE